jgi:branched-subunit amino acid ABC-type transport system permease component
LKKTLPLISLFALLVILSCVLAYTVLKERAGILLATIVNGVLLGGFYGLTAMGLSLVLGITRIINVCHGEFVVLGAYIGYWLAISYGVNPMTLIASLPILFIVGLVIGKTMMNRAVSMGVDQPLLVAFGLSLCLRNLMRYLWDCDSEGDNHTHGRDSIPRWHVYISFELDYFLHFGRRIAFVAFVLKKHVHRQGNTSYRPTSRIS